MLFRSQFRNIHFSQLKFDGENGISVTDHLFDFLEFCEYYEIDDEEFSCVLFSLTLEGRIKKWCHTLPATSIHSFEQLIGELQQAFHRYDFQDVLIRINDIRMKPCESIEEFSIRFVHTCFEFPERDVDWTYLIEQFRYVVFVSLEHFQSVTKPDPSVYFDNPKISSCSDFVPNVSLSISLSLEHIQASQKNITIPPPDFLPNGFLFANSLSDEICL